MISRETLLNEYIFNFIFNMFLNVFYLDLIESELSKFSIKLLNPPMTLNFPVFKFFNGAVL
jgi:hypothetical protein